MLRFQALVRKDRILASPLRYGLAILFSTIAYAVVLGLGQDVDEDQRHHPHPSCCRSGPPAGDAHYEALAEPEKYRFPFVLSGACRDSSLGGLEFDFNVFGEPNAASL